MAWCWCGPWELGPPQSTIYTVSLLLAFTTPFPSRNQELRLLPVPAGSHRSKSQAMKKIVVLYPGLAVSHFVPMVQLADVLLEEGYAVVVAFIDPAQKGDIALPAVVDRLAASKPSVVFHMLPRVEDAPTVVHDSEFYVRYIEFVGRYSQRLHDFLVSMPPGSVHAVLVDMMAVEVLGVTSKLGIPAYGFFPSNASALAVSIEASSARRPSFGELGDAPLNFHGVPPIPASHLYAELLEDPGSKIFKATANLMRRIQDANGILVNTSASIEPRAVSALSDPLSFPEMPPVYCVGPLVAGNGGGGQATEEKHECLAWLDKQPEQSVVFLCFGSTGAVNHSEEQLKEIAVGLERSGHRFLWVVRAPFDACADPDLDALLPAGFLERTAGRGCVVKVWAPQVDVLQHVATGAFVTHCGWNSVMEGIVAGVPMLCWPLYSEQKMNMVFMVEEYGIGVKMVGWQQGLVKAEEVEAKVRLVMEWEEGKLLRARVSKHKEDAAMAWKDGGSSRAAFARFLSQAGNLGPGLN